MQTPHFFPLGEGLELTEMERQEDQLVLHVMATSRSARCPLCHQPATRLHSRYRRLVKDLPCTGQQVQLILHVRKFFCDTVECVRKVFAERLPQLVAPWTQMTTRWNQALQTIGLARLRQARCATGRASGHHHVLDDHCPSGDGYAHPAGRSRRVSWPRRFCLSTRQNGSRTVVVDLDAHQIIAPRAGPAGRNRCHLDGKAFRDHAGEPRPRHGVRQRFLNRRSASDSGGRPFPCV